MKMLLCLLMLCIVPARAQTEESLPKISPAIVLEIQRLAITLRLAEYPLSQNEYINYLALPPFLFSLGVGGKNIRSHHICKLTDPADPLGYYGFNIYWGEREKEAPHNPLIDEIELFFQPGNFGKFPPVRQFVLPRDISEVAKNSSIAFLKQKMKERHQTPGEFVKGWYLSPSAIDSIQPVP
jgi:hypothetical protein